MKTPFPSAKRLLDHHSCFGVSVIVGFLRCTSCCCVRRHQEWAASVPTFTKKDPILEGTMVVLQIGANVTRTEHVIIVSTSRPAGNDTSNKQDFCRGYISLHVFCWCWNFLVTLLCVLRLAESLLTFMVADTLHIDRMKTFPVDIVIFVLRGRL